MDSKENVQNNISDIQTLYKDTLHELDEIWTRVGLTKVERENHIKNLNGALASKLGDEKALHSNYQTRLEGEIVRRKILCANIAQRIDNSTHQDTKLDAMPLKECLKALKEAEDKLKRREEGLATLIQTHSKRLRNIFSLTNQPEKLPLISTEVSTSNLRRILTQIQENSPKMEVKRKEFNLLCKQIRAAIADACFTSIDLSEIDEKVVEQKLSFETDGHLLSELKTRKNELDSLKEQRNSEISKMVLEGCELVRKTGRNLDDFDVLKNSNRKKFNEIKDTVQMLQGEYKKDVEKRVKTHQKAISDVCEDLRVSKEKLEEYTNFGFLDDIKGTMEIEAALNRLEERVDQLERLKAAEKTISLLFKRREAIVEESGFLKNADPARFKIPGQLIREEKIRMRARALPRITQKLRKELAVFAMGAGREAQKDGVPYKTLLDDFERKEKEDVENARAALEVRRMKRMALKPKSPITPQKARKTNQSAKRAMSEVTKKSVRKFAEPLWKTPSTHKSKRQTPNIPVALR